MCQDFVQIEFNSPLRYGGLERLGTAGQISIMDGYKQNYENVNIYTVFGKLNIGQDDECCL